MEGASSSQKQAVWMLGSWKGNPHPPTKAKEGYRTAIFTYLKGLVIKNHYHQAYLRNTKFLQSKNVRARLEHALILVNTFTLIMSKICVNITSKTTAFLFNLRLPAVTKSKCTTNILPSLKLTNKRHVRP